MMMFQSFYTWIVAGNTLPVSNFSKVLFLFSYTLMVFLYTSFVLGLRPYVPLMNLNYLSKRKSG